MPTTDYKGRFAPSPTGPVHFGTLVAAVGSYLQAKKNNGQWIIRMEDVDTTRKVTGADTDILKTLETFGFEWSDNVLYQSEQNEHYQQALDHLIDKSLVFPCICSRKQLNKMNSDIYPGTCRNRQLQDNNKSSEKHALRLLANDITVEFNDTIMGRQSLNIKYQCGDFVIKRRDNLFAYQLAVVVDDAIQGITEVVRGADLLDCTAQQIYLQGLLQLPTPQYCHLPLAVDNSGNKISKSDGGAKVDTKNKEALLIHALNFLGQHTPDDLNASSIQDIWNWATNNWDINKVTRTKHVTL